MPMLLQTNQTNLKQLLLLDQFQSLSKLTKLLSNNTLVVFLQVLLVEPNLITVSLPSDGELMPPPVTISSSRTHGDQHGVITVTSRSVLLMEQESVESTKLLQSQPPTEPEIMFFKKYQIKKFNIR
jgi:hypothetical protein